MMDTNRLVSPSSVASVRARDGGCVAVFDGHLQPPPRAGKRLPFARSSRSCVGRARPCHGIAVGASFPADGWTAPGEASTTAVVPARSPGTAVLAPSYLSSCTRSACAVDRSPPASCRSLYWALVREDVSRTATPSTTREHVAWFRCRDAPRLAAFDHNEIVEAHALWKRLRNKVGYSRIAHGTPGPTSSPSPSSGRGQRGDPRTQARTPPTSAARWRTRGPSSPPTRFLAGSHRPARLYRYNR